MIEIDINDMTLSYSLRDDGGKSTRTVFAGISNSFKIAAGSILGVMGESGSGKSTLLRLIAGTQPCTSGSISVDGLEVSEMVYLPQGGVALDHLSLHDNLHLFSKIKATKGRFDLKRLQSAIHILELDKFLEDEADVARMSGGERQRVSLARVFSLCPKLILLDEPCAGIGGDHRQEFLVLLKNACSELKTAAILASHDFRDHSCVASSILFLSPPDHHHRSQLTEASVPEFGREPPWREAVAYAWHVPVNWLEAVRTNGSWTLSISDMLLGAVKLIPEPDVDTAFLACPPSSVAVPTAAGGQDVWNHVGSSDLYSFYRRDLATLIAPGDVTKPSGSIGIEGAVHVYSESGAFAIKAMATPTP